MAFLSEIHYQNHYAGISGNPEFVEVTLSASEAARAGDFQIATYQTDGTVRSLITLTDAAVTVNIDPVTGYYVYTVDTLVTASDRTMGPNEAEAVAFVDNSLAFPDNVLSFVDIGGGTTNITAVAGPAAGATSVNIPASPNEQSIQWDIWGNRIDGPYTEGTSVTCFAAGTRIDTANGLCPVQDLFTGDLVRTSDHGLQAIRWIGSARVAAEGNFAPVVITEGALGNERDLVVSPQHRMLLSGWKAELLFGEPQVLCAAIHLVNGDTIYRREGGEVEYFHMMFDSHEIVFSEGCPSESFFPGEAGMGVLDEATREEIFTLFPELRKDLSSYGPTRCMTLKSHEARALTQ